MRSRRSLVAMLAVVALPASAAAQIPALPGGGIAAPAAGASPFAAASGLGAGGLGGVGGVGGLTAAPKTIWGFFGLSKSNLAACKTKICASPVGALITSGLAPYTSATGGLIPGCCPTGPTDAQGAALAAAGGPTGAEAVAAKIKQDEAEAKARRAAVRYLSTVDCHYWPEAEAALIGALRDDRNECVRYEAALALLNGCCCTPKTIEALNIVVSCSEKDGKPSETSDRVKSISFAALQRCLTRVPAPPEPAPPESPEAATVLRPAPTGELPPGFRQLAYYYRTIRDVPPPLILADARRTVTRLNGPGRRPAPILLTGERSLYGALAHATQTAPATPPGDPATSRASTSATDSAPTVIPLSSPTPAATPTPVADGDDGLTRAGFVAPNPAPAPVRAVSPVAPMSTPPVIPPARLPTVTAPPPAAPRATPAASASRRAAAPVAGPTTGRRNLRDLLRDSASPPSR